MGGGLVLRFGLSKNHQMHMKQQKPKTKGKTGLNKRLRQAKQDAKSANQMVKTSKQKAKTVKQTVKRIEQKAKTVKQTVKRIEQKAKKKRPKWSERPNKRKK